MSTTQADRFSIPHPVRFARTRRSPGGRMTGDRGEGVISAAIAVLIMAFLGAAMWVAFNSMWSTTEENTREQIEIIGTDG